MQFAKKRCTVVPSNYAKGDGLAASQAFKRAIEGSLNYMLVYLRNMPE